MNKKDEIIFTYLFDYKNIMRDDGYSPVLNLLISDAKKAIENKEYSSVNIKDEDGNTFLHLAMENEVEMDLIIKLIESGADVSIKNNRNKNCFQVGKMNGKNYFKVLSKTNLIKNLISNTANQDNYFFKQFNVLNKNTIKFFISWNQERYGGQSLSGFLHKAKKLKIKDDEFIFFNAAKEFSINQNDESIDVISWFKRNVENGDMKNNFFAFFNGLMSKNLTLPSKFFHNIKGDDVIVKIAESLNKKDNSMEKENHSNITKEYLGRIMDSYKKKEYLQHNIETNYSLDLVVGIFINYVINNNNFSLLEKDLSDNNSCLSALYLNSKLNKDLISDGNIKSKVIKI